MKTYKRIIKFSVLFFFLGIILFLIRINFNFYPDSYYYLVSAKDFTWQDVGGYNPFYMSLIALLSKIFNVEVAAHLVSAFAGSLIVLLCGILNKLIFKKTFPFTVGVLLALTSWNVISWSRLVLTESLAICEALLFIVLIYLWQSRKGKIWLFCSLATLILAYLTRKEYLLLGFISPLLLSFFKINTSTKKVFKEAWSLITLSFLLLVLNIKNILEIYKGTTSFIYLAGIIFIASIFILAIKKRVNWIYALKIVYFLTFSIFAYLYIIYISGLFLNREILNFPSYLSTIFEFITSEFIIFFFVFWGIWYLILNKKVKSLISIVLILLVYLFVYLSINPLSTRYLAHIVVFLLILAFHGVHYIYTLRKRFPALLFLLIIIPCILQIKLLFTPWLKGEDYHQMVVKNVDTPNENTSVLISCTIEPFLLYSNYNILAMPPTETEGEYDIYETYKSYKDFYVVVDETSWDYCTGFSQKVVELYKGKIYKSFINNYLYYSGSKCYYPESKVRIYKLRNSDIEELLKFRYIQSETGLITK